MARRSTLIALLVLVAIGSTTTVAVAEIDGDAGRIFWSNDEDGEFDNETMSDLGDLEYDSAAYYEQLATVEDFSFRSTAPEQSFNGTTVQEYRRRHVARANGAAASSVGTRRDTGWDYQAIGSASVGIVGIDGGARPRYDTGLIGGDPAKAPVVGPSGSLLVDANYDIDFPDDEDKEYPDDPSEGQIVSFAEYHDTERSSEITLSVDGEQIRSGESPPRIPFDDLDETGEVTLTVNYTVRASYHKAYDREKYVNGSWDDGAIDDLNVGTETEVASAEDSIEVVVTGAEDLEAIEQTVINVSEDRSYVAVDFPDPPSDPDREDLRGRYWQSLEMNESVVTGPWRMYTTKHPDLDHPHDRSLQQYLVSTADRPGVRVASDSDDNFTQARIVDWSGTNLSSRTKSHDDVNLSGKRPILYDRIVIEGASGPVESVRSIHGREIDLDDPKEIPYRTPEVSIESLGDREVRVSVTDPETGDGIANRRVYLFGTARQNVTTDSDGNVVVDRQNMVLRADVEGDELAVTDADVLYDGTVTSRVFFDDIAVLEKLSNLLLALTTVLPLVLFYLYVRQFRVFK